MPNIQAILFDFGQVLTLPPRSVSWARMEQLANIPEERLKEGYWQYRDDYDAGLFSGDEYWQKIVGDTLSAEALAGLKVADVDLWTDMNQPMLDWVGALHASGFRTGILSNMPDAMADGICDRFDWIVNFDHTIWSHALKLRKPQPEIYAAAIEGLAVRADRILFIDDKPENTEAAEVAGMNAIIYKDHSSFVEEMNTRGLASLLHPSKAGPSTL